MELGLLGKKNGIMIARMLGKKNGIMIAGEKPWN